MNRATIHILPTQMALDAKSLIEKDTGMFIDTNGQLKPLTEIPDNYKVVHDPLWELFKDITRDFHGDKS